MESLHWSALIIFLAVLLQFPNKLCLHTGAGLEICIVKVALLRWISIEDRLPASRLPAAGRPISRHP